MVVLGLTLTFSGCEREHQPLRLGATIYAGYIPLFLAERNKAYAKQISMVQLPNATETMRAFRNGVIDVAAVTLDEAIVTRHYIPDATVFLILNHSNGADILLARPPLSSIEALKGKKVGVEKSALGAYFLKLILEKSDLSEDDLEVVPILSDGHYSAYKNEGLDAIVSFEPFASQIKALGAKNIFDSSKTPFKILDVLITRKSFLKTHEKQLKTIVDGWYKMKEKMSLQSTETLEYSAKHSNVSVNEYLGILSGIGTVSKRENRQILLDKNSSFYKTEAELYESLLALGFINEKDVLSYKEEKKKSESISLLGKIYP